MRIQKKILSAKILMIIGFALGFINAVIYLGPAKIPLWEHIANTVHWYNIILFCCNLLFFIGLFRLDKGSVLLLISIGLNLAVTSANFLMTQMQTVRFTLYHLRFLFATATKIMTSILILRRGRGKGLLICTLVSIGIAALLGLYQTIHTALLYGEIFAWDATGTYVVMLLRIILGRLISHCFTAANVLLLLSLKKVRPAVVQTGRTETVPRGARYCGRCGMERREGAAFCPCCGRAFE